MADAVPTSGFGIPPLPAGASVSERPPTPPASAQVPGFVPPAPAPAAPASGLYSQEQVDAMIAAARAGAQPAPVPAPNAAPANPAAAISVVPPSNSVASSGSDPVLDSMTTVFMSMSQGIDLDRAVGKAISYGDASLIDLAYIREKGGATAAQLEIIAKGIVDRVASQADAASKAVYEQAGGEAAWQASAAAFNTNAPAHTKLVIKQMLDSGNPEHVAAAAKTVVEFAKSTGLVVTQPGLVNASAGMSNAQALDKLGFQAELRKLNPNARGYEEQRAELFARRALGKSLGQ